MSHPLMRAPVIAVLCAAALCGTCHAQGDARPWGYRLGEARPPGQANFCDDEASALEIADIFERFGPRTGFSALSNSPSCSTRVHGVTPRALLRRVRVALEGGGEYYVSFIRVYTSEGTEPVLVTTRRLADE